MKALVKSPLHYNGIIYQIGSTIDYDEKLAKYHESIGVVEILSTIVEPVENLAEVKGESVPDPAPQEVEAKAEEEAPKAPKKTSKRRIDSDDE